MTRYRKDVEDSATQIQLDLLIRPIFDFEVGLDILEPGSHQRRVWLASELVIPANMIAVGVGMRNDKVRPASPLFCGPFLDNLFYRFAYGKRHPRCRGRS